MKLVLTPAEVTQAIVDFVKVQRGETVEPSQVTLKVHHDRDEAYFESADVELEKPPQAPTPTPRKRKP